MNVAFEAMRFAREKHANQVRKYTGDPYTNHLAEVAGIAGSVIDLIDDVRSSTVIATAWLHDVVEDCGVSLDEINDKFGYWVALGVKGLSDLEEGNRADRKAASRARLAKCPGWVQTIKCADLISNTSSIVKHDPKFAVTYLAEKRALLDVLTHADRGLLAIAISQAQYTGSPPTIEDPLGQRAFVSGEQYRQAGVNLNTHWLAARFGVTR